MHSRVLGGILGIAAGDALGVPVEFTSRTVMDANPVTAMAGYGTHNQPPGTWSDDTSLMLCLLQGLTEDRDLRGIARLFTEWRDRAYWTATGVVFDIGISTSRALDAVDAVEDPRDAGRRSVSDNGNGSLMRTWPVALAKLGAPFEGMAELAEDVSSITHAHPRSRLACVMYCALVRRLLNGEDPPAALDAARAEFHHWMTSRHPEEQETLSRLLHYGWADWQKTERRSIKGTGYVLDTLEASIWCVARARDFAEACLLAVNLGEDTDTTGAVTGGLAGTIHGVESIPPEWLDVLARRDDIRALAERAAEKFAVGN